MNKTKFERYHALFWALFQIGLTLWCVIAGAKAADAGDMRFVAFYALFALINAGVLVYWLRVIARLN
jgi:hypothetical protein